MLKEFLISLERVTVLVNLLMVNRLFTSGQKKSCRDRIIPKDYREIQSRLPWETDRGEGGREVAANRTHRSIMAWKQRVASSYRFSPLKHTPWMRVTTAQSST